MNWEHLPKNAVDNETIEQAIVRIVAQHNNDNTAHMATGQSIDVHRKESILDHKAGSVLADKETMSELKFYTTFESLDMWFITGYATNSGMIGCQLYVEDNEIEESSLEVSNLTLGNFLNTNKDMMFQSLLDLDLGTGAYEFRFGQIANFSTGHEGFGFKIVNNTLYTVVKGYQIDNQIAHNSISVSVPHIYRAQYISGERKFYFFIDGVQIHTYTLPSGTSLESDVGIFIGIKSTTLSDGNINITNVTYARSI